MAKDPFNIKRKSKEVFNAFKKNAEGEYLYGGSALNLRKKVTDQFDAWKQSKYANLANAKENYGVVEETNSPVDDKVGLQENVLHKFATYNYIFTLSGLSEDELQSHAYLTNPVHDIIARSGGIGDPNVSDGKYNVAMDKLNKERIWNEQRTSMVSNETYSPTNSQYVLSQGLDLFFENFNMLSTVGPNSDRGLANITKMNFELVEPFGVSLVEKVKAATFINGYRDFQDAPLLLTIEFKGTDENGKPITSEDKNYERKIPILIVRVEFDLDQAGSRYQVIAVPFGDLAHDDRFKFPRTTLTASVGSVGEWIETIEEQLYKDQLQEIKEGVREYVDEYEFIVSSDVEKNAKYARKLQTTIAESNANFIKRLWNDIFDNIDFAPKIELAEAQVTDKTSLVKFFEDAIRTGEGYSVIADRFWQYWHMKMTGAGTYSSNSSNQAPGHSVTDRLTKFYAGKEFPDLARNNQWVDWFEIKVSVETIPGVIDKIRKMSPKRIIFKAIPKKIHVLKFFPPGVTLGFIDWNKWVRKNYNYIYTGENVDIQSLRINYKTAYYLRNVRPFKEDAKEKGQYQEFEENLKKVFGSEQSDLRSSPSNLQGTNSMESGSNKSQQFYDYITNPEVDMIRVELEILGDPAFICQDQFINIHRDRSTKADGIESGVISPKYGSFNSENFQPLVKLSFQRPPDDIDDQMGRYEHHGGAVNERGMEVDNQTFTGIYQVVKVDSKFNNGQFLQTLHLVRMNQQQGNAADTLETSITKVYGSSDKNTFTTAKPGSSNPRKPGGNDGIETSSVASKVSNAVKTGGVEVTLPNGRTIYKKKRGQ